MVDGLNSLVEGLTDEMLGNGRAILRESIGSGELLHLKMIGIIIKRLGIMLEDGSCDDHILGCIRVDQVERKKSGSDEIRRNGVKGGGRNEKRFLQ